MADTRKEVQEQIERAEIAPEDKRVVELRVSRQDYRDLVDAKSILAGD